jgi:hypothetical protein
MFKRLCQNKRAQQTAEYAILIALVVGAVIAMQTYAQRTIQARIRGASRYLSQQGGGNVLGNDLQYEPYYLDQAYTVSRNEDTTDIQNPDTINKGQTNRRGRKGHSTTTWDNADQSNW